MLTYENVVFLPFEELGQLWEEGKLDHLIADLVLTRSESGSIKALTYEPLDVAAYQAVWRLAWNRSLRSPRPDRPRWAGLGWAVRNGLPVLGPSKL